MFHRKLEAFGNSIGFYLEKLKIPHDEELEIVDKLELIIKRKYITNRFWSDEIQVYADYKGLGTKYQGSIFVACHYKPLKTDQEKDTYEYDSCHLDTGTEDIRQMRKNQAKLVPFIEKIKNAIINEAENKYERN